MFVPMLLADPENDQSFYLRDQRRGGLDDADPETKVRVRNLANVLSMYPLGDGSLEKGAIANSWFQLLSGIPCNVAAPAFTALSNQLVYPSRDLLARMASNSKFGSAIWAGMNKITDHLTDHSLFAAFQAGEVPKDVVQHVQKTGLDYVPRRTDLFMLTRSKEDSAVENMRSLFNNNGIFGEQPSAEQLRKVFFQQVYGGMPPFTDSYFHTQKDYQTLADVVGWVNISYGATNGATVIRDNESLAIKLWRAAQGQPSVCHEDAAVPVTKRMAPCLTVVRP